MKSSGFRAVRRLLWQISGWTWGGGSGDIFGERRSFVFRFMFSLLSPAWDWLRLESLHYVELSIPFLPSREFDLYSLHYHPNHMDNPFNLLWVCPNGRLHFVICSPLGLFSIYGYLAQRGKKIWLSLLRKYVIGSTGGSDLILNKWVRLGTYEQWVS